MPKNDNPHAVRLMNSLIAAGEKEAANTLAEAHPLSKSADFQKKFEWASNLCTFLDAQFDDSFLLDTAQQHRLLPYSGTGNRLKSFRMLYFTIGRLARLHLADIRSRYGVKIIIISVSELSYILLG